MCVISEASPTEFNLQPVGAIMLPSLVFHLLFSSRLNLCAVGDGHLATEPGEDSGNLNSVLRFHLNRFPKHLGQSNSFASPCLQITT